MIWLIYGKAGIWVFTGNFTELFWGFSYVMIPLPFLFYNRMGHLAAVSISTTLYLVEGCLGGISAMSLVVVSVSLFGLWILQRRLYGIVRGSCLFSSGMNLH